MFYPEELVEEVRSSNDIVDVISGYISLQKKGNNYWGCCPFHNEKTPSFSVSGPKQMYHCFGCGVSGNVFTFLMEYDRYTFPEAIKLLADRVGISLPEIQYTEEQKRIANRKSRLLSLNKEAATYFYYMLKNPVGELGREYLKKRQLQEETIRKFGLGYAGKNGALVVEYLKKKGYSVEEIKDSGIATFSERNGLMSQFWNRVMFPIFDVQGKVIGFGGRVMGDGEPKYLNSPETDVFDKRRNLYGLNYAKSARSNYMILCEGYMDVISMHQAGFTQAVASLGTAFTPEQAHLLHRYTENVYLAYDSDGAGVKAALKAIGILRNEKLTAKVINMRPYKDPDEFMKALGQEAFEERIQQAENGFMFEIRMLSAQYNRKDPEEKTKFELEIARRLCLFENEIERENYLQAVAETYYIGTANLKKYVLSYAATGQEIKPPERPKSGQAKREALGEGGKKVQRLLLTWIADEPSIYDIVKKYITVEDFTEELYQRVAARMFSDLAAGTLNPAAIISTFEDEESQRQAGLLFHTNLPGEIEARNKGKALKDILISIKKNSYQSLCANPTNDPMALNKLILARKELQDLEKANISINN